MITQPGPFFPLFFVFFYIFEKKKKKKKKKALIGQRCPTSTT